PPRILEPIGVPYTDEEREVHTALRRYTRLRTERAQGPAERFASEFVLKTLKKRLFSCPAAFLTTLEQHEKTLRAARSPDRDSRWLPPSQSHFDPNSTAASVSNSTAPTSPAMPDSWATANSTTPSSSPTRPPTSCTTHGPAGTHATASRLSCVSPSSVGSPG